MSFNCFMCFNISPLFRDARASRPASFPVSLPGLGRVSPRRCRFCRKVVKKTREFEPLSDGSSKPISFPIETAMPVTRFECPRVHLLFASIASETPYGANEEVVQIFQEPRFERHGYLISDALQ